MYKLKITTLLSLSGILLFGGSAYAAGATSIKACVKASGPLYLVSPNGNCQAGEQQLILDVQGP